MIDPYDKPSLSELSHYGVLGMKWNRRKSRTNQKKQSKNKETNYKGKELVNKGMKIALDILKYNFIDDLIFNGAGKKSIKATGRIAVTAFLKLNGHKNITWLN